MSAPRLGNYQITKVLGRGGMAEVLLARRSGADGFSREVVIKRILTDYGADPNFVDMFRDEARITALLRHGNIAQVLEFGEDEGKYFLVLEYVDGPALGTVLTQLRASGQLLSPIVIAYILSELARALDYAHRKRGEDGEPLGIVHRDVSPSNTLLSKEGEVKLADFGIARARERITSTNAGGVKGKLAYMSPEMLHGIAEARSDLFALGVMGWEMVTGNLPFDGETAGARMTKTLACAQGPLRAVSPDTPVVLSQVIDSLLAKSMDDRPSRGFDVTQALAPLVNSSAESAADLLSAQLASLESDLSASITQPRNSGEPGFSARLQAQSKTLVVSPLARQVASRAQDPASVEPRWRDPILEPTPSQFAPLSLDLPVAPSSPRQDRVGKTTVAGRRPQETPRALIVERSATARALLRSGLPGFAVVELAQLAAAVAEAQKQSVSLVVSQHQLARTETGIDLFRTLRALPGLAEVPFALVLSAPDPAVERRARDAGITLVVNKTDPETLLKRLRELASSVL